MKIALQLKKILPMAVVSGISISVMAIMPAGQPKDNLLDGARISKDVGMEKRAYLSCMQNASYNDAMKACADRAVERTDAIIKDDIMKNLQAKLEHSSNGFKAEAWIRIDSAQKSWLAFRDASCRIEGLTMYQGTGESLVVMDCARQANLNRIKDLLNIISTDLENAGN